MEIKAIKTRIFNEGEDLTSFILGYIKKLPENSVLVVTSKIVALVEGRVVVYKNEKENQQEKIKLIKKESDIAVNTKIVWLTIKDGIVMANAGIDESNANGKLVLLPKDSFKSAEFVRGKLMKHFKVKNLGVLITDSRLFPLRSGVTAGAIGYAGFSGVRDYVGKKDIFGKILKMSKTNIADSLATASALCMGEGNEMQPLAMITNAPVVFTNKVNRKELIISPEKDIYAPFFKNLKNEK